MKFVAVTGSRTWDDWAPIRNFLNSLKEEGYEPESTTIVHGGARGADAMTGWLAKQQGFNVIAVPADWKLHGRAAGPIRNEQILDQYKPELLMVFRRPETEPSPGTDSMVRMARERKVTIRVPGTPEAPVVNADSADLAGVLTTEAPY